MRPADVLDALDIAVVQEKTGRKGTEFLANCPWHHEGTKVDNNPSWWIREDTGQHICFSCGFAGGLGLLVSKVRGISIDEALAWLGEDTSLDRVRHLEVDQDHSTYAPPPMNLARLLMFDRPTEEMLWDRGLDINDARDYRLRYDEDHKSWVIPLFHPDTDEIMGYQEKGVGWRHFKNRPLTMPKSTTLFGLHLLDGSGEVIVVESPLDAVYLHHLGHRAVSSCGAHVSREQMDLLVARTEGVLLMLDNDEAGRESMLRVLGRSRDGSRQPRFHDWSTRIPIRVFNFESTTEKDAFDIRDPEVIDWGIDNALGSLRAPKVLAA